MHDVGSIETKISQGEITHSGEVVHKKKKKKRLLVSKALW